MNLKRYPEYKDSGVKWLGDVPEHWKVSPLGQHFMLRNMNVSDKDFPPLSVTKSGILPQMEHVAKTENGDSRKLVLRGDFVINSRSDRKGSSGIADRDGSVSQISIVLEPRDVEPRFVHHLLRSVPFQEEFYRFGTGIVADLWSTRFSSMKTIRLAVPPASEQKLIVAYLDRELDEIDAFIADQEELIELLSERRKSALHTATAEVHTSPKIRLRYLYRQSRIAERPDLEVLSVYRDYGVIPKSSRSDNLNKTPEDVSRYLVVRPAYLVVNKMKAWQGSLGISHHIGIVSPDYEVLVPLTSQLLPEYAHHILRSAEYVVEYAIRSVGIRPSQWRLYWDQLKDISIPVPDKETQLRFLDLLQIETNEIDSAIADARESIALSKERRAAVISAAVTGKIDVRGLVDPATSIVEGASVGAA